MSGEDEAKCHVQDASYCMPNLYGALTSSTKVLLCGVEEQQAGGASIWCGAAEWEAGVPYQPLLDAVRRR